MNQVFTDEENFLLAHLPSMIGASIASSAKSGVIGTVKEAVANAKSVLTGVMRYPNNTLIQGVLPQLEDRQEALQKAQQYRDSALQRLQEKGIDSAPKLRRQMLEDCRAVNALIAGKASSQEAAEYRDWAMTVAEKVAMAAKEGSFLGFGGERVSAAEKALAEEIAEALGASSKLA